MEAVSFVAREPWSDHPVCASAVIGAFLRSWNDELNNDDRNRLLKPLVPALVGTAGTPEQEDTRVWMALDWLVRVCTPVWLRAAGLLDHADRLEALPELHVGMDVPSFRATIDAVRSDAAAAWAAAEAEPGDASWVASMVASWVASWAEPEAVARDAAWAAAGVASRYALRPTIEQLQVSAMELVERMIAVTEVHSSKMGSNN